MRMYRWFVTAIVLAVLTVFTPATAKRFASVANPSSASLAAGFAHSLALTPDGVLWSWGDNTSGQLGDGTRATRTTPVRVAVFQATPVAVAAGGAHSLALGGDGVVWAWGLNDAGQVGDASTVPRLRPTRVAGLMQAVSIAAGTRHSLAVRADGVVVAWGANDNGQLGDGTTRHRLTAVIVPGLSSAVAVAAGSGHSLAVTSDGTLWAWGDNIAGQLGDGTRHERRRPIRVAMSERAGAIAAGALHSLVIGGSGAVYAFGANLTGQLGDGTHVTRLRPVRVRNVSAAIGVSAGVTHSVAVTTAGGLWTWGGLSTTPRAVASPAGIRAAAAGGAHNLVLTDEGAVWTQGINLSGQLGDGTRGSRADFVPISGPDQAWGVYPPMFSPGAGIYDAQQIIRVSTPTPGATIHYTTDGTNPTSTDRQVPSGGTVAIDRTTPLKARGFRNGLAPSAVTEALYALVVSSPVVTPAGGAFTTPQHVVLGTATAGAAITYTLDGSEPTEGSPAYSGPVPIATSTTLRARAFRGGWNDSAVSTAAFTFDFGTLAAPAAVPPGGAYSSPQSVTLSADAGATIRYTRDGTEPSPSSAVYDAPIAITATTTLKAQAYRPDWTPSAVLTVHYVIQTTEPGGDTPPPDPATLAPPLPEEVLTDFADAVSFLYTGPNAIQREVVAGAIEEERVAVVRGRVLTREGSALPGVRVTVRGQSGVGYAVSRADGLFDVALNAGGPVVIEYTRTGFLPAQRRVEPAWNAFAAVDDVRLVQLDPQVTVIDFSSVETAQVARGTPIADADGMRQATLIVPEGGVNGTLTLADGSIVPAVSSLSIRATEYTVGNGGEQSMPAPLPGTSGYTYAVELSADEALQAGATKVAFDRPLAFYVENFLDFPVGGIVPAGYYDRREAQWIASDNGRVVRVLAIDDGRAILDVDGTGLPASAEQLAALGVTEGELQRASALYLPGQSLWRIPISHFTPYDGNWPVGLPLSVANSPGGGAPGLTPGADSFANRPGGRPGQTRSAAGEVENPCLEGGSIIECQNQTLGETIAVAGTPFTLTYRSNRATGPAGSRTIRIPVTTQQVPDGLKRIDVDVAVAGQETRRSFAPAPGLDTTYVWDGRDRFGRGVIGAQDIDVVITYVYPAAYYAPADLPRSFAAEPGTTVVQDRARGEVGVQQKLSYTVDTRRRGQTPIAGWNLDVHHRYDPKSQTLYLGSGEQRTAAAIGDIVGTIAGGGQTPVDDVEVAAEQARFEAPLRSLAVAASGEVFVVDRSGILLKNRDGRVRRVTTFIDNQDDPQPALATAPGTGVYAAVRNLEGCLENDLYSNIEIHYLAPSGTSSVLATVPISLPCNQPLSLTNVSGALLLAAGSGFYRIDLSAGEAVSVGGLPLGTAIWSIAGARDGTVYLGTDGQIWRMLPSGQIDTIAGRQSGGGTEIVAAPAHASALAGAEPADRVRLHTVVAMAVDRQGNVLFADHQPGAETSVLKALTTTGKVVTLSGDGAAPPATEGGLARAASVHSVFGLSVTPGGETYYVDNAPTGARVRRFTSAFERDGRDADLDVPSADGALIYRFTVNGVHRRTLDALTGVVLYSFEYDDENRLVAVEDRDGRLTRVLRNGSNGDPAAIVSPFGVTTQLSVAADGSLQAVTDPEGHRVVLSYTEGGLLSSFTNANGHTHTFTYDGRGRLIRDDDPAGGFQVLERTSEVDRWTVTRTVADGGSVAYTTEQLSTGATRRVTVGPDGSETVASDAGAGSNTVVTPDGTVSTSSLAPDPRFRFGAPITSSASITSPSGLTMTLARDRSVLLANPEDPLSLVSVTDTTSTNGNVARSVFDAEARTITSTTPADRGTVTTLDVRGRPATVQVGTLAPTTFVYNALGQLESRTQGNRTTTFTYDARGYVASVTDPLQRTVRFTNDAVGRRLEQIFPDDRVAAFSYDNNGNLRSLTPPGRTAHQLTYTAVDRLESYTAPSAGGTAPETRFAFNLAGSPTSVTRADGQDLRWTYDAIGRLAELRTPDGNTAYEYQTGTGQLAGLTSPSSALAYTYDGSLQTAESWSGVVLGAVDWTFDHHFRVISERVRGSSDAVFDYDADGLLTSAGALSITRDDANGFIARAAVGTVATTFDYNEFGEIVAEETTANGIRLFRADYTRDAGGRLAQKSETVDGVVSDAGFVYDLAGRLTGVTRDGVAAAHYEYDANGNRTVAAAVTATYDGQDRLITRGTRTYQHTATGEVSQWTDAATGETTTLTYDTQGNLLRVNLPGGTVVEYVADARNRRVQRRVNGAAVQGFLYQGQLRPVAELDGTGALVTRFVYGARATSPEYMVRAGTTYRLVTDHVGSIRLVVDSATGEVVQRMDYDAYGRVLQDTNPGFQPFGYAGGLYDPLTGLVRFGVRDYDPEIGRFLSEDPIGFESGDSNLYAYVGGDPVNRIDPTGAMWFTWGWTELGETAGQQALNFWANRIDDQKLSAFARTEAYIAGLFAALWTPCSSMATAATLSMGKAKGAYIGRPYWQYRPSGNEGYNSAYVTRGWGWRPPHTLGPEAAEKLSLPPHNPGTAVTSVTPSPFHFVSGPERVGPKYGHLGGGWQYVVRDGVAR